MPNNGFEICKILIDVVPWIFRNLDILTQFPYIFSNDRSIQSVASQLSFLHPNLHHFECGWVDCHTKQWPGSPSPYQNLTVYSYLYRIASREIYCPQKEYLTKLNIDSGLRECTKSYLGFPEPISGPGFIIVAYICPWAFLIFVHMLCIPFKI